MVYIILIYRPLKTLAACFHRMCFNEKELFPRFAPDINVLILSVSHFTLRGGIESFEPQLFSFFNYMIPKVDFLFLKCRLRYMCV